MNDFTDAWASIAAATPRRRKPAGAFPHYTTAELIRDAANADDATRERIEAEIARRLSRQPRRS